MAFGFAFALGHHLWCNLLVSGFLFLQRTGNLHFGFVAAILALTDLFEFFLRHWVYLLKVFIIAKQTLLFSQYPGHRIWNQP
jgi:hypothetical protein